MKKKDLIELKSKSTSELKKKALEGYRDLTNTQVELKMGNSKNVHLLKSKRKEKAQILTFLKINSIAEKSKEKGENSEK